MKRIILIIICCLFLFGCSKKNNQLPSQSEKNENSENFVYKCLSPSQKNDVYELFTLELTIENENLVKKELSSYYLCFDYSSFECNEIKLWKNYSTCIEETLDDNIVTVCSYEQTFEDNRNMKVNILLSPSSTSMDLIETTVYDKNSDVDYNEIIEEYKNNGYSCEKNKNDLN